MKIKGKERKKKENNTLLNTCAYELESRVFGFDKSTPVAFKPSNIAEAVTVNAKPIRNWIKILFCFPKRRFEMTEDKTNIHAKEQTKIATVMLLLNHEAKEGVETLSEDATVVSAVLVKIW
jgi:hypothetical protein